MSDSGDQPLVTDTMLGIMVVFGADIVLLVGVLWAVGVVSTAGGVPVIGAVAAVFLLWVLLRWAFIRRPSDESEQDPIETLKQRYADGELTEREFEQRTKQLLESTSERSGDDTAASLDDEMAAQK